MSPLPPSLGTPLTQLRLAGGSAAFQTLIAAGCTLVESHLVAPNTQRTYASPIQLFEQFCHTHDRAALPASHETVFAFLMFRASTASSYAVIKAASGAIYHMHNRAGFADPAIPTRHPLVQNLKLSLKRILGETVRNRKDPLLTPDLISICDILTLTPTDPVTLMLCTMCSVMFAGCLRYSDAAQLLSSDITLFPDHVELFLAKRKNDQFRHGDLLVLAKGSSSACPHRLLTAYLPLVQPSAPLFQSFNGYTYSLLAVPSNPDSRTGHPIRDDQCRRYIRKLIQHCLQLPPDAVQRFATHSLRIGSATVVAAATDISEAAFRRHGGWRSDASLRYIHADLQRRLATSKQLGY